MIVNNKSIYTAMGRYLPTILDMILTYIIIISMLGCLIMFSEKYSTLNVKKSQKSLSQANGRFVNIGQR